MSLARVAGLLGLVVVVPMPFLSVTKRGSMPVWSPDGHVMMFYRQGRCPEPCAKRTVHTDGGPMTGKGRKSVPLSAMDIQILLSMLEGPSHGYAVITEITRRTNGDMKIGTSSLYAAIRRMLEDGWVMETAAPRTADRSDVRRRYYVVTREGKRVLKAEARRLEHLQQALRQSGLLSDEAR